MIYKYKNFLIKESVEIAKRVNDIYQNATFDEKVIYDRVLVKYLKKEKSKYNINTYKEGDLVLIEYWYNGMLTPVKIVEKNGSIYTISHDIKDSKINKAPNSKIKKSDIIDFYIKHEEDLSFKGIDLDVNLYNAISILPKVDQQNLYKEITNIKIDEETTISYNNELYDKTNLSTFLKCLNALNIPNDFNEYISDDKDVFLSYKIESVNKDRLIDIFERFPSMVKFNDKIKLGNKVDLYFNLKVNDIVSKFIIVYGMCVDGNNNDIAEFSFSKKEYDSFVVSNNKYIQKFMVKLKDFNHKSALLLMKLKLKIGVYSPSYYMKKKPIYINDNTIIMSFYGIGKWDSGVMLTEDYNTLKNEFKSWVKSNIRDYKAIKFSIVAKDFWTIFKIKL